MSEMIERVARAICEADAARRNIDAREYWCEEIFMPIARAAIEAMRTPTIEMMEDAVSEFTFQSGHWGPETTPETIQKAVFQRAIDAALSEKP